MKVNKPEHPNNICNAQPLYKRVTLCQVEVYILITKVSEAEHQLIQNDSYSWNAKLIVNKFLLHVKSKYILSITVSEAEQQSKQPLF